MAAPEEKLRGKQAAAIAALLSQRTIAEAAHQVGMGERTLLRWLQEDCAFQAVYRMARRHVTRSFSIQCCIRSASPMTTGA